MFSIDVKILDTDTKKIIKSAKSVGEGENSILKSQIDQLSEQIAAAVNLPANEFAKSKKPIIDVTTNSLEAYKYHLLGFDNYTAFYDKEAKENFVRAVNLDSTFAMAHIGLAFTYWREGYFEKMNIHLELAKKYRYKLTHKEQIRLDFAYDRRKGNDYTKSMNAMKKATSLYPKEKQLFHVLGDHIYYTGDVDTAITYLKKALDLDPNFKSVLRLMGYSYMKKKDYTKAIEYLNRYIDVAPNEAGPYDSMGDIYLFMTEYEKSIEMYQRALEIKPDFGSQSGIVSNYIQMRDIQKARNYLYQWSDVTSSSEPDRFRIHYYLAGTYLAEGDLKMTLKELEKRGNLAKQISNEALLFGNYLFLSEILYENRKIKESEENLAAAKKLIGSSDFSEEQKDFVLKMYLWHSTRHAVIKGSIDQAKEFAKMYKVELEKNEDLNLIKRSFALSGLISQAEGNYEKAIDDLKQSNLDNPFNNYHLALAYIKNGDENNAIAKLESVVNYPGYVSLRKEMFRARAEKQLSLLKAVD
jgi:tetratricopeptide (TPR) repeat protein